MMKSHEIARAQNQRIERRIKGNRFGPDFVEQTRMAAIEKEKRMIQRELERIRKGVHRPPRFGQSPRKATHILNVNSYASVTISLPSLETDYVYNSINPEYSKGEEKLYDSIVFLQNNPSALVPILDAHAQSDAYLETLERISPRITGNVEEPVVPAHRSPFVPRYLKERSVKSDKALLLRKYESLLRSHSPILRKKNPAMKQPFTSRLDTTSDDKVRVNSARTVIPVLPPIGLKADELEEKDGAVTDTDLVSVS